MGAVNTMPTPVPYKVGPEGNTVPLGVVGGGMFCVVTAALVGGVVITGWLDGVGRDTVGMAACMMGAAVVLVGTVAAGMVVPTIGVSEGGARITGMDGKGILMGVLVTTLGTVAVVAFMLVVTGVWMDAAVVIVEATEITSAVVLTDTGWRCCCEVVVAAAVVTAVGVAVVTAGVDTGIVTVRIHVVIVAVVVVAVVVVAVVTGVVTAAVAGTTGVTMVVN
jgi:hypothetical protein